MANTMQEMLTEATGGLDPFDAPIPGESLTSSPQNRMPYEQSPEYVSEDEALQDMFVRITRDDVIDDILDGMRARIPVENIAQMLLFEGFRQGKFNPDLMMLMTEPTIYMLLTLAEVAGIHPVLAPEDDDDEMDFAIEEGDFSLENLPEEISLPSGQILKRPSLLNNVPEGEAEETFEEVRKDKGVPQQ